MVGPILFSNLALKKENDGASAAQEWKGKEVEENYGTEKASHRGGQLALSLGGLNVAACGLGAVLFASVFVALLAIERNLRALRRQSLQPPQQTNV